MKNSVHFVHSIFGVHHTFIQCLHACVHNSETGPHPRQGPILGLMLEKDGMSQADIVREMRVSAATVAVSLARLEKLGLITREKNQQNQRANILYLTEKGRNEATQMRQTMDEISEVAMEGFTPKEAQQLEGYCARMIQNLQQKYKVKECGLKHAPHD